MQTSTSVLGKRRAEADEDGRFAKRFHRLSLDHHDALQWKSVVPQTETVAPNGDSDMEVDETPNRVYIHNLQDEIAEIEAQEQAENQIGIFPPNVAKIPQHLLRDKPDDNHNQQLILYSVPKSLTEDEGHDSVRKAIIEARQRAREKANLEASRAKETETEPGADEDEMDLS